MLIYIGLSCYDENKKFINTIQVNYKIYSRFVEKIIQK
jgi:hypothetical protein